MSSSIKMCTCLGLPVCLALSVSLCISWFVSASWLVCDLPISWYVFVLMAVSDVWLIMMLHVIRHDCSALRLADSDVACNQA